MAISKLKYSLIAKKVFEDYCKERGYKELKYITWGDPELMERLFIAFGGDRKAMREKTGCIGHHFRFKFVMDKLDKESQAENSILKKSYIKYSGIINRPTRCFSFKEA